MGAVLDLVRVLFEPAAVFERVREKPRFIAPVLTVMVLSVVIGFLSMPFLKAGIAAAMAQAPARGGTPPDPSAFAIGQIIGGAIFVPIIVALVGGLLWIAVSILGAEAKYRALTSVAAYTSITYILQLVAGFAVLSMRGVESITSPLDLQPAFGLDLLAPGATGYLRGITQGINVFSVWGAVLNGIGITTTHRTSKAAGYGAAAAVFIVLVLLLGLLALLQPTAPS